MSTVLLMTDAWQPTVLRLVPFSSNNARSPEKRSPAKGPNGSRGFPVLAVTRSSTNKTNSASSDSRSCVQSASSLRTEVCVESDTYSTISNVSGFTNVTDKNNTSAKNNRRYVKKKVPEAHSTMKEAMKFSVQDINDQVSSTSSLASSENKDEKDKHERVDNTRTRLPKPSLNSNPDPRTFYSPVNGVRRSVPLTPGELELQRIRDSYYVEQVQKKKKYKLNINQLPRSTTPINDHDPDKLNMKQVIAFLQTKTSKEVPKKVVNEKKGGNSAKSCRSSNKTPESVITSPPPTKLFAKEMISNVSRCNSDVKSVQDKLENTRQIPGCMSVMSTKSSPNLPYGGQTSLSSGKAMSTRSGRSFRDRNKDRRSDRQRPAKEFKLYRFLAIAPDGQSQGIASSVSDAVPTIEKSFVTEDLKSADSNRRILFRRSKDRESHTARILHRHVINRSSVSSPKSEPVHTHNVVTEESTKAIRLPMVNGHESPDIDSDTGSSHSTVCKPVQVDNAKNGLQKQPAKSRKSISFDENVDVNIPVEQLHETDVSITPGQINGYSEYSHLNGLPASVKAHKSPAFPRVNISGPKQIHVNVPQEQKKVYSQEIVRLTLRHEKNATRVTSYMSDIQTPRTAAESDSESNMEPLTSRSTGVNSMDHSEWLENSRHNIQSLNKNNFIKVRQKLKVSNS